MRLWEDLKAKWRGETRLKGAKRGRLYIRKDDKPSGSPVEVNKQTTVELVGITITRADGTIAEIK